MDEKETAMNGRHEDVRCLLPCPNCGLVPDHVGTTVVPATRMLAHYCPTCGWEVGHLPIGGSAPAGLVWNRLVSLDRVSGVRLCVADGAARATSVDGDWCVEAANAHAVLARVAERLGWRCERVGRTTEVSA